MNKTKTYSVRFDDYENAALDFLVKDFQEKTNNESKTHGYPPYKWSRSSVLGVLISIQLRAVAENLGKTPKDLIGLSREWENESEGNDERSDV